MNIDYWSLTYWDHHHFRSGTKVITGLAIVNRWITWEDALPVTYSFN